MSSQRLDGRCSRCGEKLPVDRRDCYCKACRAEKNSAARKAHPQRHARYCRDWYERKCHRAERQANIAAMRTAAGLE